MQSQLPVSQVAKKQALPLNFRLTALCSLTLLTATAAFADINPGGSLSNFEIYNDTGVPAHGFEIEIQGGAQNDIYYTGYNQRYFSGTTNPIPGGINIRWQSPYAAGQYTKTTPTHDPASNNYSWQDCYLGGAGYATSGCEIFGQGLRYPVNINMSAHGYFLIDDTANPGNLLRYSAPVAIPTVPTYSFPPPTTVTAPPAVVVEIEAPEPIETPETYGDAQWVKVYKTELSRSATADDLIAANGVVPLDLTQLESSWDLLQNSPPSSGNQNRKGKKTLSANVKANTRAIIRRVETYKYTGAYDAVTHQAICADLTCSAPAADEVGNFIGANNTAVNVNPDALSVVTTGKGNVSDASRAISCGNACATFAANGSVMTLTANPSSGNVFAGWSGACSGSQSTCTATINGVTSVNATFKTLYGLSVSTSNPGTVTSADKTIDCGKSCSAKLAEGTLMTLTATPPAGKQFLGWTGACSGTAPVCSFAMTGGLSTRASFSK